MKGLLGMALVVAAMDWHWRILEDEKEVWTAYQDMGHWCLGRNAAKGDLGGHPR
jgi:hypothetical protein